MLIEILVLAACLVAASGLVLRATDSLPTSASGLVWFVVLPLIGSAGFVTLAGLSAHG